MLRVFLDNNCVPSFETSNFSSGYFSAYKSLAKNLINSITSLVTKTIKSSSLDPNIQKHIIPHNPQNLRIYGQPKIHKKYLPLQPIASIIGAPTQALARFLVYKLQTFTGKTSSIKDSTYFILKTKTLHLDEEDIMVSFNVVSLFTKILVFEALTLISNLVDLETLNLIKIVSPPPSSPLKVFSMNKLKAQPWGLCYCQLFPTYYGAFQNFIPEQLSSQVITKVIQEDLQTQLYKNQMKVHDLI
jgi:hypothetical protein